MNRLKNRRTRLDQLSSDGGRFGPTGPEERGGNGDSKVYYVVHRLYPKVSLFGPFETRRLAEDARRQFFNQPLSEYGFLRSMLRVISREVWQEEETPIVPLDDLNSAYSDRLLLWISFMQDAFPAFMQDSLSNRTPQATIDEWQQVIQYLPDSSTVDNATDFDRADKGWSALIQAAVDEYETDNQTQKDIVLIISPDGGPFDLHVFAEMDGDPTSRILVAYKTGQYFMHHWTRKRISSKGLTKAKIKKKPTLVVDALNKLGHDMGENVFISKIILDY